MSTRGLFWRKALVGWAVLLPISGLAHSQSPESIEQLDYLLDELDPPNTILLLERLGPMPVLDELLAPLPPDFVPRLERSLPAELSEQMAALTTAREEASDPTVASDLAWELFELAESKLGAENTRTVRARWLARHFETLALLAEEDRAFRAELSGGLTRALNARKEGRLDEAVEITVELVTVEYELMGRAGDLANPLGSIAAFLYEKGDFVRGERTARAALEQSFEEEGIHNRKVASSLNNIASLVTIMRRLDMGARVHAYSLAMRRELFGDQGGEFAQALLQLAGLFRLTGDTDAALRVCDRAIVILETTGELPDRLGILLTERGVLEWMRGEDDRARASLQRSIEILRSVHKGDRIVVADALGMLSDIERNRGNFEYALELAQEAYDMQRRLHDLGNPQLGMPLHRLANSLELMGDFAGAERAYRDALASMSPDSEGFVDARTVILVSLTELLWAKGDLAAAREMSELATLDQRARMGGTRLFAGALRRQARRKVLDGDLAGAQRDLTEALAVCEALLESDHATSLSLNVARANVYLLQGEYDAAREIVEAVVEESSGLPGAARKAHADANQVAGELAALEERYEDASKFARVALRLRRELLLAPNPELVDSLFLLGQCAQAQGDSDTAIAAYSEALGQAASMRTRIAGDERDRAVFAGRMSIGKLARTLALQQIDLSDPEAAFDAAEQGRERALLDLVQRSGTDLIALARETGRAGAERLEEQLNASRQAEQRLRFVEQKIRGVGSGSVANQSLDELEIELRDAQRSLQAIEGALESSLRAVWPSAEPLSAKAVAAALGSNELLLHYTFDEEGIGLIAVRGGPEGAWVSESLVRGASAVAEFDEQLRTWISGIRTSRNIDASLGPSLSKRLLPDSIWKLVVESDLVILVPDGVLNELPFECVMTPDGTWLESGPQIVYSPSATLFARERSAPRPRPTGTPRALVLGNPTFAPAEPEVAILRDGSDRGTARDMLRARFGGRLAPLPGSKIEAESIAQTLGEADWSVDTLMGPAAANDALQATAPGATLVHLATHAFAAQAERPYESALALAWPEENAAVGDAFLSLDDLIRHWGGRLNGCDLVVLSACDTQVGVVLGESRVALSWGFFFAGADSVLVSLWKVDDRATALLMDRFYSNYVGSFEEERRAGTAVFAPGEPMNEAAALQEAKAWLASSTPEENKRRLAELGFNSDLAGSVAARGEFPRPSTGPTSRALLDAFDFRPPRFGAAFVLYGQPD